MARGSIGRSYLDQQFALAEALHTVWYLADAQLQADVERAVGVYAQQTPQFKPFARIVTAVYDPPFLTSLEQESQFAAALQDVCELASAVLRNEIDQSIHAYKQRNGVRHIQSRKAVSHYN